MGDRLRRHRLQHPLDHGGDPGEGDLAGEEGAISAEDAAEIRLLAGGILTDINAVDAKVPSS